MIAFAGFCFAGAASAEEKIVISDAECARAIKTASVAGAAYVPGVDVRGNKVAGANLAGDNQLKIPDELTFDISPNLYELIGQTAPKSLEDTTLTVGTIKVTKDGAVTFNGQRLNAPTTREIVKFCKARLAESK